jgi:hypothetical protein
VFKQCSPFILWWYPQLKENVHFIPLFANLSDLEPKIEWARLHDAEARQIAEAGFQLVMTMLSKTDYEYEYFCKLLRRYASYQVAY